jgi:hypothetical protein
MDGANKGKLSSENQGGILYNQMRSGVNKQGMWPSMMPDDDSILTTTFPESDG